MTGHPIHDSLPTGWRATETSPALSLSDARRQADRWQPIGKAREWRQTFLLRDNGKYRAVKAEKISLDSAAKLR